MSAPSRARHQRDYLGIWLWAVCGAAAVVSAGAAGDNHHDLRRALADAAAVVTVFCVATLAARAVRRRNAGPAVAVAWRASWLAMRALSLHRQNARRIDTCESRQRQVIRAIEADVAEGCGADGPTMPGGVPRERWLAPVPARGEREAAG